MPTHNARAHRAKIARAKEFYSRYEQGESYQAIADDNGLTRQRVWQLVRDYRKALQQDNADIQVTIPHQRVGG